MLLSMKTILLETFYYISRFFFSTNIKNIGILYLSLARFSVVFLIILSILMIFSLLIRMGLAYFGNDILMGNYQLYAALITIHAAPGFFTLFLLLVSFLLNFFRNKNFKSFIMLFASFVPNISDIPEQAAEVVEKGSFLYDNEQFMMFFSTAGAIVGGTVVLYVGSCSILYVVPALINGTGYKSVCAALGCVAEYFNPSVTADIADSLINEVLDEATNAVAKKAVKELIVEEIKKLIGGCVSDIVLLGVPRLKHSSCADLYSQ